MEEIQLQKNITSTLLKMALGFVPGGHVIDEIVEYRNKLVQERITEFIIGMQSDLDEILEKGVTFDVNTLKTPHFIDALEVIMKKIAFTQSEGKIQRFKIILVRQMFNPDENRLFIKYLKLVEELDDIQILLLKRILENAELKESAIKVYTANASLTKFREEYSNVSPEFNLPERASNVLENWDAVFVLNDHKDMTESDIIFYLKELESIGFIRKKTPLNLNWQLEDNPLTNFPIYEITGVGTGFLVFIQKHG